MNKKRIGVLFFVMMIMLSTFFMTACKKKPASLEYDFTETDATISYNLFSLNFQDFEGAKNDKVIEFIENKFNVKINISGSSESTWKQRLNTEIADGKTPDLFFYLPTDAKYSNFIDTEVIIDFNAYVDRANAKNLKAMFDCNQFKDSTKIKGKNYFLPQSTGISNHTLYVRTDWMKKWNESKGVNGNPQPTTLTQFTEMLTYFATQDPDGDGNKDNNYGLSLPANFDFYKDFMSTFGVSPDYTKKSNGDVELSSFTANYDVMMDWFKNGLKTGGYIYPDFYIQTEDENRLNFLQGRCGAMISNGDGIIDGIITTMRTKYPDNYMETFDIIAPPNSDDGHYKGAMKGWESFWGGFSLSADAKEPMRLIKILDYLMSPEGQNLLVYGIKDYHYTVVEGKYIPNYENRLKDGIKNWAYPDVAKANEPGGKYSIGTVLLPVPFVIENNNLVRNFPSDTFLSPELVEKSYDIADNRKDNPANYSALRFLISDTQKNEANSKIMDAVKIYTFNVIAGNNKESERKKLDNICSNNHLNELLAFIKAHSAKE